MINIDKKDFFELANLIPAAIFIAQDNKYIYYNEYFKFLTGLNDNEIKDKNFWDLVHDDYKELIKTRGQQRAQGENIISRYEFKINYKNSYKWVDYSAKSIIYKNKKGFIGIAIDITEKKQFEEELKLQKENAEKSNQLKTAFLSNISHEIRTPMNSILGFSNILLKDNIDSQKKIEYAKNIQSSTKQLLEIINDIIEISKIKSNNVEINIEKINLTDFFNNLHKLFDIEKKRKNKHEIKLNLSIPKETHFIITDAIKLKQILSVLLNNAIKFTNKGEIEFGFNTTNNEYTFFVKDTGIGIKKELLSSIFDRFFFVDLSQTKNYGGTGLGLAICKYYVKILGGNINVSSKIDVGSKFTFNLPKELKLTIKPYTNIQNDNNYINLLNNKTIFIIENDELQKILFIENLNDSGINIVTAKNYNAIKELNNQKDPDLIIIDADNPDFDGLDILSKIRLLDYKIPIIFISSLKYYNDLSIKAGANLFILKPIDFNLLKDKLKELLFY